MGSSCGLMFAESERILEPVVREVILAQEIDVPPGEHGMGGDRVEERLFLIGIA